MNLLDRLLGHDAWTTRQLLEICVSLDDNQLDQEFDIGHKTLRATFVHIISNMEVWSCLIAGDSVQQYHGTSVSELTDRLANAACRLTRIAQEVADRNAWDEVWLDILDDPPKEKSFGSAIAHIITHSMHHRAQILYMLRKLGVGNLPEGDVFSWESSLHQDEK